MEPHAPADSLGWRPGFQRRAWLAIVVLALCLRILPIGAGLPYSDYVDEGHVLNQVVQVLHVGSVNIGNYSYPWLPSFLVTGAVAAYSPIYQAVHGRSLRSDLLIGSEATPPRANYYDLISPTEIIVLSRLTIALLSVATVILTGWLGTQIAAPVTGLGAMLLTAVCPALVSRGSHVIIDSIATFFVVAMLCFCERLRRSASGPPSAVIWCAVGAGTMTGLALASKYTMAVAAGAVLTAIALLPIKAGRKITLLSVAGVSAGVATVFANPVLLLEPMKVLGAMQGISGFYNTMMFESYWTAAISSGELGIPLVFAGLAGAIWMLGRPATRSATLAWLAFTILLLIFLLPHRFQPFRNLVSTIPFFCIAAAFLVVQTGRYLAAKFPAQPIALSVTPGLFLLLAGSISIPTYQHLHARISRTDTRIQAIDWLHENTQETDRILAVEELAIFPAEWKRVPGQLEIVPWQKALEKLQPDGFDYVVTGAFMLQFASNPDAMAKYREQWRSALAPREVVARFGQVETPTDSGVWRTNDQRILILKRPPR